MGLIYKIKYPSLELNWLPNSFKKDLLIPPIIVSDNPKFGGRFFAPSNEHYYGVSLRRGLIEISTCGYFESTIAHEYRHYWQTYSSNLGSYGTDARWLELFQSWDTYKQAIVGYFTTQPHEMDALLFERTYAPNNTTDLWWEWIKTT